LIELGREKHARRLEDLVGPTQLEHLSPKLLDLLTLGRGPQIRPQPLISLALAHHLRNVSDGIPRSLATCAIGRPDPITNLAPRSSSSGGYFLGRDIRTDASSLRGQNPRQKASVKPSLPQPLIELLEPRTSEFVYPSPRGKLWGVRNFYRNVWHPAQAAAGVSFTLYDLRHTFASRLLSAGIPPVEVSAWMGHSLRMAGHDLGNTPTRVYAHATDEWREKALDVLAALIDDAGTSV
jgi:hypothetical protein